MLALVVFLLVYLVVRDLLSRKHATLADRQDIQPAGQGSSPARDIDPYVATFARPF